MRREGGMAGEKTDIQRAAMLFGAVFALVTILGFIPGITTNYDGLTTFDGVGAEIFGIIGVNILENAVHGLYAIAGFAAAASWAASKSYFIWGGVVYLVLWLYGLFGGSNDDSSANFLGMNSASDWLHFVLGVAMVGIGFLLSRRVTRDRTATA
ncbi:MAG: DUF4383 domain-containing protein [Actinobacteria bacterium]|nr:DUF4383 domain-containing protein [Actinomycetota bacterium]